MGIQAMTSENPRMYQKVKYLHSFRIISWCFNDFCILQLFIFLDITVLPNRNFSFRLKKSAPPSRQDNEEPSGYSFNQITKQKTSVKSPKQFPSASLIFWVAFLFQLNCAYQFDRKCNDCFLLGFFYKFNGAVRRNAIILTM